MTTHLLWTETDSIVQIGNQATNEALYVENGTLTIQKTPTANTDAANVKYVNDSIDALVDGAPGFLNTLNELAAAIGDDENFQSTITGLIGANTTSISSLNTAETSLSSAVAANTTSISSLTTAETSLSSAVASLSTGGTFTDLTVTGNLIIGNESADLVQFNAVLDSDIIPSSSDNLSLGSSSYLFSNVYATNINATNVNTTSDKRLKEDINQTKLGLDFINTLKPVSYNFIKDKDKKNHQGLIAQEVEESLKSINLLKDTSIVQYNEEEDKYSLNYLEFVAPLIKSVQELKSENDELKKDNKLLHARLEAVEKLLKIN